jgi:hypothetical protein
VPVLGPQIIKKGAPLEYELQRHVQIGPVLVHTKAMLFSKHEGSTGQMRMAAIKFTGRTAVVWSTKVRALTSSEVLVYDGSNTLMQTNDEEIRNRNKAEVAQRNGVRQLDATRSRAPNGAHTRNRTGFGTAGGAARLGASRGAK